jgi:hypothetical protein
VRLLSRPGLEAYLREDPILSSLRRTAEDGDERYTSHRWLTETPGKRYMYQEVYGDLLGGPSRSILDVGGGYCSLSRQLVSRHDYWLCEINAHDSEERLRAEERKLDKKFWQNADWYAMSFERDYDVIIANDLFPNVDQRLEIFLDKCLPRARELRLSLTYYNVLRFYKTRRVDGGQEILFMLAWDGRQTRRVLERFASRIVEPKLGLLEGANESIFENQRQVCVVRLRGGSHG